MYLTKRGHYALKALLDMAMQTQPLVSARDIAQRQAIPMPFLEKILGALAQQGLIRSKRGWKGGYELNRPLKEITVAEVLRAIGEYEPPPTTETEWLSIIVAKRLNHQWQELLEHLPLSELYYDALSYQAHQEQGGFLI
jgi:Rrf2 family iron-sulfur cluster assembly transcriptional regulator